MQEKSSTVTEVPQIFCVFTTVATQEAARHLAALLVQRRLAACAQIEGPLESVFEWEGEMQTAAEWRLVLKTTHHALDPLMQTLADEHSYDEPEILAFPFSTGSPGYINWVARMTLP